MFSEIIKLIAEAIIFHKTILSIDSIPITIEIMHIGKLIHKAILVFFNLTLLTFAFIMIFNSFSSLDFFYFVFSSLCVSAFCPDITNLQVHLNNLPDQSSGNLDTANSTTNSEQQNTCNC